MLSHLMFYLTEVDLEKEIQRLRQALPELDRQLHELTRLREVRMTKRVLRLLPRISRQVLMHLKAHHPDFLTPDRLGLFKAHLPAFGLLRRKGHAQALVLLQAQFKAYLLATRQESAEQWLLRSLAIRRNDTLRDLLAAEAEQRQRSSSALDRQPISRKPDDESPAVFQAVASRTDDADVGLSWVMTQSLMQAAMDSTPGHQARTDTPGEKAECIATDDRLGYFS